MKEFEKKLIAISKNEFGTIDSLGEVLSYDKKQLALIKKQVDELKAKERQELSKKLNLLNESIVANTDKIAKLELTEKLITSFSLYSIGLLNGVYEEEKDFQELFLEVRKYMLFNQKVEIEKLPQDFIDILTSQDISLEKIGV